MFHFSDIMYGMFFQGAFLLVYELLLKKETFFNGNRWFLLLCPLIALVLPLLKLEFMIGWLASLTVPLLSFASLPEMNLGYEPQMIQHLPQVELGPQQSPVNWWILIYAGGVIVSVLLLGRKYYQLHQLFRAGKKSREKDFYLISVPDSTMAFTFFSRIFLGDQLSGPEREKILTHELVHVRQKHSLDLMLFELLRIICWFNPLIPIFQRRIAAVHEFIADAQVVSSTGKANYCQRLLVQVFHTQNISFINQFFSHSLIKKRIIMLQRSKSKTVANFKFMILLPLIAGMVLLVACSQDPMETGSEGSFEEKFSEIKQALDQGKKPTEEELRQLTQILDQVKTLVPPPAPEKQVFRDSEESIPFGTIEEAPVFPGCEEQIGEEARKSCMSSAIAQRVSEEFNVEEMRKFAVPGLNRVVVQFRIDKSGTVVDTKARGASPQLEQEAIRVIEGLPQMQPGKQQGQEVGVMYSLPIVFDHGE